MQRSLLVSGLVLLVLFADGGGHAHCADGAEMVCLRTLYRGHLDMVGGETPAAVADGIIELMPAEGYIVAHSGIWEPVIAALKERGKQIVRYVNPTTVLDSGVQMQRPTFERAMGELAQAGHVLKNPVTDVPYRYFAWNAPYILTWDTIGDDERDRIVRQYTWIEGDRWFIDLVYHGLRPWMIEGKPLTRSELDAIYSRTDYLQNRDALLADLVENAAGNDGPRLYFYNGDVDHYRAEGHPVLYEQANMRLEFDQWLADWRTCDGCVMELRTPGSGAGEIAHRRILEAVGVWKQEGGIIWADNLQVAEPSALGDWLCGESAAQQ